MRRVEYCNVQAAYQVEDAYCYLASLFAMLQDNNGSGFDICAGFDFDNARAADDLLPM